MFMLQLHTQNWQPHRIACLPVTGQLVLNVQNLGSATDNYHYYTA